MVTPTPCSRSSSRSKKPLRRASAVLNVRITKLSDKLVVVDLVVVVVVDAVVVVDTVADITVVVRAMVVMATMLLKATPTKVQVTTPTWSELKVVVFQDVDIILLNVRWQDAQVIRVLV